jgi:hypothetical protein
MSKAPVSPTSDPAFVVVEPPRAPQMITVEVVGMGAFETEMKPEYEMLSAAGFLEPLSRQLGWPQAEMVVETEDGRLALTTPVSRVPRLFWRVRRGEVV